MITHGTAHFVNKYKAARYYHAQGYVSSYSEGRYLVAEKLRDGEIKIGKPVVPAGATLVLLDGGTRYGIREG